MYPKCRFASGSSLGAAYSHGKGVEQDDAKSAEFYEKAAMQGHADSRQNLGNHEGRKGNNDRAVRHFLISAKMGHKLSVEQIKRMFTAGGAINRVFMAGIATNEQCARGLKGYHDSVEETKTHDRDKAKRLDTRK